MLLTRCAAMMAEQPLLALGVSVTLVACGAGTNDASINAELGWALSYTNWSDATAEPDLRGCDNVPAYAFAGPAYPPIDAVRVRLLDPEGTTRDYDQETECRRGANGERFAVRGVGTAPRHLLVEAKDATGNVLYSYTEKVDLTERIEAQLELRTVTGEQLLQPAYPGPSFACAPNVTHFRTTAYRVVSGVPETTPAFAQTTNACDAGLVADIYARGLPSVPQLSPSGNLVSPAYHFTVEALDATGATLYCGSPASYPLVDPGPLADQPFYSVGIELAAGVCP